MHTETHSPRRVPGPWLWLWLLLAACGPAPEGRELPFRVLATGDNASFYAQQHGLVLRTPQDLAEVWRNTHMFTIPPPAAPPVDFADSLVLAVFAGEQTGGGYGVVVEEVILNDTATPAGPQLLVRARQQTPGPDDTTTALITYPYQLVVVSRDDLPPDFATTFQFR